jgi:hypothetical protein
LVGGIEVNERHFHPAWRGTVFTVLVGSVIVGVFATTLLDGGRTARITGISLSIIWLVNFLLISRSKKSPRHSDLMFVRWGWLLAAVAAAVRNAL